MIVKSKFVTNSNPLAASAKTARLTQIPVATEEFQPAAKATTGLNR
jgi:hypothetical protein